MKRKASLLLSVLIITAYAVKHYASSQFAASLAFTLPPLATDVVTVFMLLRAWRHEPVAQDESWGAFFGSLLAAHLFLIADLAGLALVSQSPYRPVQTACAVLLASSYPLAIYTLLVLGRSFSVLPEAKGLVTSGPYRWSRHPLYVLYTVWYVLLVGVGQTPLALGIAVTSFALQLFRARREEQVLASAFGDEYARYRASTGWIGRRTPRQPDSVDGDGSAS